MLHDDYLCLVESGKQQIKEVRRKLKRKTWKQRQLLSESGFVLRIAPPSLSRDRRIKMKKSINQSINLKPWNAAQEQSSPRQLPPQTLKSQCAIFKNYINENEKNKSKMQNHSLGSLGFCERSRKILSVLKKKDYQVGYYYF